MGNRRKLDIMNSEEISMVLGQKGHLSEKNGSLLNPEKEQFSIGPNLEKMEKDSTTNKDEDSLT